LHAATAEVAMGHLFLISGASRGLGAALAECALADGHSVISIARSPCPHGDWLALDLVDHARIEPAIGKTLALHAGRRDGYVLVNNAAMLEPIGSEHDSQAATDHLAVNLVAPVMLSRAFLRALTDVDAPKRIVNISSGAAVRPFDGWAMYCASKAGLDQFGRCLALEQQRARHPADVVSVSPGVIDTAMQATIRASDPDRFPLVDAFRGLQAEGELQSPAEVAAKLLRGALSARRFDGAVVELDAFAANR
jgi:benzil reductase ((S)-benzoin forming)